MKKVDSQALAVVNKALGLTGAGAPVTELTDGVVDQTLDVGPLVRRGRTLAGTEGCATIVLRAVHGGATTLTTEITPYALGTTGLIAPFPNPIPTQFDLWLLSATLIQISGTGTLSAALFIGYDSIQGFGIDNAGNAVVSEERTPVALWDALITKSADQFGILTGTRGPLAMLGIRIPRNLATTLVFISTSSAAATFEVQCVVGLFPIALGQDGIS